MPRPHTSSELNQPFQIGRATEVADGAGGFTTTEAILPSPTTYHFAKVLSGSASRRASERDVRDGLSVATELLFVAYAAVDIREADVILYHGERYNVRACPPPGLSLFREVIAEAGVPNG